MHLQLSSLFPFVTVFGLQDITKLIAGCLPFCEGRLIPTTGFWEHLTLWFIYAGVPPPYQTKPLLLVAVHHVPQLAMLFLYLQLPARGRSAHTEQLFSAHTGKLLFSRLYGTTCSDKQYVRELPFAI